MSIRKLLKSANKLNSALNSGKEFLSGNVYAAFDKAASENPGDVMINMMRDYVEKRAHKSNFINQKEIGEAYDSLINYAGGEGSSQFRTKLGGYLPVGHGNREEVSYADVSHMRAGDQKVKTLQEYDTGLNSLAKEFSNVFDLDKKGSFSSFSNNTSERARKFAAVQLKSLGCEPKSTYVSAQNDHYVLVKAAFATASKREVSVDVPVQVSGGVPKLPTHYVNDGNLEKLSKENIMLFLKQKEDLKKFDERAKFASARETDTLRVDNVTAPKALDHLTNIEDSVIIAASAFDNQQVNLARNVLASELKAAGFNCQVKLAGFGERHIEFETNIANNKILFPVEFAGGRPLMPSRFVFNKSSHDFSSRNLMKVANQIGRNVSAFSLQKENFENMSYHQLTDEMIRGVSEGNYKVAEDALGVIQKRFDDTSVSHAVQKYASLLKTAGMNKEREDLVKSALERGDLIRVPTSVDLYSPKLGLPLSKLAFDGHGNLIPMSRVLQRENQGESESFGISSYQIKIN